MLQGAPPDAPDATGFCGVPLIRTSGGLALGGTSYAGARVDSSVSIGLRPLGLVTTRDSYLGQVVLGLSPGAIEQPAPYLSSVCLTLAPYSQGCGGPSLVGGSSVCLRLCPFSYAGIPPCQPCDAGPPGVNAYVLDPDYGWTLLAWVSPGLYESTVYPDGGFYQWENFPGADCQCATAGLLSYGPSGDNSVGTLDSYDPTTSIGQWVLRYSYAPSTRMTGREAAVLMNVCGPPSQLSQPCVKLCPSSTAHGNGSGASSVCVKVCPSSSSSFPTGYTGCSTYSGGMKGHWTTNWSGFSSDCSTLNVGSQTLPQPASGCTWSQSLSSGNVQVQMQVVSLGHATLSITSLSPPASWSGQCSSFTANGPNTFGRSSSTCTSSPTTFVLTGS